MKRLAVYVEGGGDTAQQKAELRKGFEALFEAQRNAMFDKGGRLDFIPSGGRQKAYEKFMAEFRKPSHLAVAILLVDSEEAIVAEIKGKEIANAEVRKTHLIERDKWDLAGVPAACLHLMVQCMETWIVADAVALASFYGKGFHASSLPARSDLEDEPKRHIYNKLDKATEKSSKGKYGKIKHASKLLALIDIANVRKRCPRYVTFSDWLDEQIADA